VVPLKDFALFASMPRRPKVTQLTAAQSDALVRALAVARSLSVARRGTD
jgi:hypothetical protein